MATDDKLMSTIKRLLTAAQETIEKRLPYSYRAQFVGSADNEYLIDRREHVVVITLTHGCGERFRAQRMIGSGDSRVLATIRGGRMGAELASNMKEHMDAKCGYNGYTNRPEAATFSTTDASLESDDAKAVLILDEPEPEPFCPICGPSDWEDDCSHDY